MTDSGNYADGATGDHCSLERPWQQASATAQGSGADLFWQFGDTISTGRSHDDGFTIYYGDSDWQCLVTNHIKAIG
jgi:mannan endo-1,4-beta-mannosidase